MSHQPPEDPVVRSARREAVVALLIWAAAMCYTIVYCAWYGYGPPADPQTFIGGFPEWFLWGVVAPWLVCVIVSWWYAYRFMTDEPLGEGVESQELVDPPGGPGDE